jgi:hypothetical protein
MLILLQQGPFSSRASSSGFCAMVRCYHIATAADISSLFEGEISCCTSSSSSTLFRVYGEEEEEEEQTVIMKGIKEMMAGAFIAIENMMRRRMTSRSTNDSRFKPIRDLDWGAQRRPRTVG